MSSQARPCGPDCKVLHHPLPCSFDGNLFEGKLSFDRQWGVLEKIGSRTIEHDVEGDSGHTYYHLPESWEMMNEWKCGDIISFDLDDRVTAEAFLKSLCPWGSIVGREYGGWIVSTPWPILVEGITN